MNFRELTSNQCLNNRQWIPEEAKRTALESKVLSDLQANIDAFLKNGGLIYQAARGESARIDEDRHHRHRNYRKKEETKK